MSHVQSMVLLLGFVGFAVPKATAQDASAQVPADNSTLVCSTPEQVAWLLGSWESAGRRTVFRETWTRLSDETWEGVGKTLEAGTLTVRSEEALRLVGMAGGLFYVAKVAHNELPIAFAATACSDTLVVFENPKHDFPRRIAYRLVDSDHVTVDVDDGEGQGFRLEFSRMTE